MCTCQLKLYLKAKLFFFGLKTLCFINIKVLQTKDMYIQKCFSADPQLKPEKLILQDVEFFARGLLCDRLWRSLHDVGYYTDAEGFFGTMQVIQSSLSVGLQSLCGLEETTYHLPLWIAINLSSVVGDAEDLRLQCWRLVSISTS